ASEIEYAYQSSYCDEIDSKQQQTSSTATCFQRLFCFKKRFLVSWFRRLQVEYGYFWLHRRKHLTTTRSGSCFALYALLFFRRSYSHLREFIVVQQWRVRKLNAGFDPGIGFAQGQGHFLTCLPAIFGTFLQSFKDNRLHGEAYIGPNRLRIWRRSR